MRLTPRRFSWCRPITILTTSKSNSTCSPWGPAASHLSGRRRRDRRLRRGDLGLLGTERTEGSVRGQRCERHGRRLGLPRAMQTKFLLALALLLLAHEIQRAAQRGDRGFE